MGTTAKPQLAEPLPDGDDAIRFDPHVPGIDYGVLDNLVGYGVRRAQLMIYDDFIRALSRWEITPPRFSALTVIANNPGLKLTDLSNILAIARSGSVLLINALEQNGLVERRSSPTDRRAYGLHLTKRGKATLDEISRAVIEHDARISAPLQPEERATLLRLLRKLAKIDN
jgi:DNA-binding MarR family transcriptional regulator